MMKFRRPRDRRNCRRVTTGETLLQVDASDPMVASITSDALLLGVWGYLRLSNRPMTLQEIATATSLDAALVQRKLDVLGSYGIVEALPSTSRRRFSAYRVLHQGLQVRVQRTGHHELMRGVASAMSDHVRALVAKQFLQPGECDTQGWHADFTGIFNLKPDEVEELRRRLNRVVEYTNMLSAKHAPRGETPELCNYVLTFRAEPLHTHALPLAPVRFVLAGVNDGPAKPAATKRRTVTLSTRERQVALGLARGLTAEEVGAQLGIKRSTVATMTKRIYAKLGVHRRAELVSRLEDALGGTTDPA